MQPDPDMPVARPLRLKRFPPQRHYLIVFFLSLMWGIFGIDRMYVGKWGTGLLKLVTVGGAGIWLVADLMVIMSGSFRDAQGRELAGYDEFKSFTRRYVFVFTIILAVIVVVFGAVIVAAISYIFTGIQDGTVPGLDMLKGFTPGGLTPEQLTELGL